MARNVQSTEYLIDETNGGDYKIRILNAVGTSLNIKTGDKYPVHVYRGRHKKKNKQDEGTSAGVVDIKGKGKEIAVDPPPKPQDEKEKENQYEHLYVKYVHMDRHPRNYDRIRRQADKHEQIPDDHENLLRMTRGPFIYNGYYALVFPFMNRGSLRSIMRRKFQYGLPEELILVVLRETLNGLLVLHQKKRELFHREINAAHIFFRDKPSPAIKLGFWGSVFDLHEDGQVFFTPPFYHRTNICDWASAPETHASGGDVYTEKSDVWLIGILALELGYGGIRVNDRDQLDSIVKKIVNKKCLPMKVANEILLGKSKKKTEFKANMVKAFKEKSLKLGVKEAKKSVKVVIGNLKESASEFFTKNPTDFSKGFSKLVAKCLETNPARRPTVAELLGRNIFNGLQTVVQFSNEVTN